MKATQRVFLRIAIAVGLFPLAWALAAAGAEKSKQVALAAEPVNNCLLCHGNKDVWEGETLNRYVTEKDFHNDIHWQKGLRCVRLPRRQREDRRSEPRSPEGRRLPLDQVARRHSGVLRPMPCGHRVHAPLSPLAADRPIGRVLDQRPRQALEDRRHEGGYVRFLSRSTARIGEGAGQTRHSPGERPEFARLSHPRGRDLREVPLRQEADGRPPLRRQAVVLRRIRPVAAERSRRGDDGQGRPCAATCNNCHGNHGACRRR